MNKVAKKKLQLSVVIQARKNTKTFKAWIF